MKGKASRMITLRRLQGCSHLRVNINAIVQAYSPRTRRCVMGGQCQDCMRRVERTENKRGDSLTPWHLAS